MSRSNWSKAQDRSCYFTMDQLCQELGVKSPDVVYDITSGDGIYHANYVYAMQEGKTEEEAEAFAQEAEQSELDEAWAKYVTAVEVIATNLFKEHHLDLTEKTSKKHGTRYLVSPQVSWKDSVGEIIKTINGVGYFHFSSIREFLDSGPYTAKQAVMGHLHWIKDHPRVYGDGTVQSMLDRKLRY